MSGDHSDEKTTDAYSSGDTRDAQRFRWAALLAGGASRRMDGIDKQSLDMTGRPLSLRILDNLRRQFPEITVVSRRPESYADCSGSVRVVQDFLPGYGPLSGLHAALSASEGEWVYLAACDMPNFSKEWAQYMIDQVRASEKQGNLPMACAASYGKHLEPFHALYSRNLLPIVEKLLEGGASSGRAPSLSGFLRAVPLLSIPEEKARMFSPDWSLFFNINTPSDWKEYLNKYSKKSSCFCTIPPTKRIPDNAIPVNLSRS